MEKELTERENEVLQLLSISYSIKEIAIKLKIQPNTVSKHKKRIYKKMGKEKKHCNSALMDFAKELGLIKIELKQL